MPFFGFLILAAILFVRIWADEQRVKNNMAQRAASGIMEGWDWKTNPELEEKYV